MVAFDVSVLARNLIGKMEIHDFNQEVRENRAARFEAALAGSGITPELITFDPDRDIDARAYLDELQSVRVV